MTHDELAHSLAEHLRGKGDRVVWEDMQLGPSGSPRPDVYSIPKSYSRFTPLAYECKVSVSDFRSDITSGKWQSYLKFAAAVIFAVPASLRVSKADIPVGCGLIVLGADWRAAKAPTLQRVETLPQSAWLKLVIDGVNRAHSIESKEVATGWSVTRKHNKKLGERVCKILSDQDALQFQLETDVARREADLERAGKYAAARKEELEREIDDLRGQRAELHAEVCEMLGLPASTDRRSLMRGLRDSRRGPDEIVKDAIQQLEVASNRLKNLLPKTIELGAAA